MIDIGWPRFLWIQSYFSNSKCHFKSQFNHQSEKAVPESALLFVFFICVCVSLAISLGQLSPKPPPRLCRGLSACVVAACVIRVLIISRLLSIIPLPWGGHRACAATVWLQAAHSTPPTPVPTINLHS